MVMIAQSSTSKAKSGTIRACIAQLEWDSMGSLATELDREYEPPTANSPAQLPDQYGPRYPLLRSPRATLSAFQLLAHLVGLLLWRWRYRPYRRLER